jgi:hypothetical protein
MVCIRRRAKKRIVELVAACWNETRLFQSINFHTASSAPIPTVFKSTFPLAVAAVCSWRILHMSSNGLLHYYPGSHKLPLLFLNNADYQERRSDWLIGDSSHTEYEVTRSQNRRSRHRKTGFPGLQGDVVVIWHANLMHGGEPHLDRSRPGKARCSTTSQAHICHEIT